MANPTPTINLEQNFIHQSVNSLQLLKALNVSSDSNGLIINVSSVGIFQYQNPSTYTPNEYDYIEPNLGDGLWVRQTLDSLVTTNYGSKIAASNIVMPLDDLSNIIIDGPLSNQVLTFNGANWENKDNLSAPTTLTELTDVNINSPTNNQALVYNASSLKWINSEISIVQDLSDLGDVTISSPTNNQVLTYNSTSSKWNNIAPQAVPFPLEDITNIDISSLENNDVLTWNSGSSTWINLPTQPVPISLDDLTDVIITNPSSGELLGYNGTNWINVNSGSSISHNSLSGLQGGAASQYYHLNSSDYSYLSGTNQYLQTTSAVSFKSTAITNNAITSTPSLSINTTNLNHASSSVILSNLGTGVNLSITNGDTELEGTAHSNVIKTNAGTLQIPVNSSLNLASFGCASPSGTGIGFSAEMIRKIAYGSVLEASVSQSGDGYQQNDWVVVDGGTTSCQLCVNSTLGEITSFSIITPGSNYSSGQNYPYNVPATNGAGAIFAIATTDGAISAITVTNGGAGYSTYDKLTITPQLTPSTLCQILVTGVSSSGAITDVEIAIGGQGYQGTTGVHPFGYTGMGLNGEAYILVSDELAGVSASWGMDFGNIPNAGGRHIYFNANGTLILTGSTTVNHNLDVDGNITSYNPIISCSGSTLSESIQLPLPLVNTSHIYEIDANNLIITLPDATLMQSYNPNITIKLVNYTTPIESCTIQGYNSQLIENNTTYLLSGYDSITLYSNGFTWRVC